MRRLVKLALTVIHMLIRSARLVFPGEPGHVDLHPPESDPEDEEDEEEYEIVEGDPLADYPDDTEVRLPAQSTTSHQSINVGSGPHSLAHIFLGTAPSGTLRAVLA